MKSFNLKIAILLLASLVSTFSFAQITGKISVNQDFYADLKSMHGSNLSANGLVLEVWRVKYLDVQTTTNGVKSVSTRIYLQEKLGNTNVPLTEEPAGSKMNLKFKISNLPATGDLVLVYYLNSYPDKYLTVQFDQKANDGTKRAQLNYQANVSTKIGTKKKWGLYSINRATPDYAINLFSSTQVVSFGLLDDIGDFFSDLADAVWEGGKTLAGVFVDAAGTIITQGYGIVQSLVTDDGVIIPRYREVSGAEYSFVNTKIFNNTLPPRDKIIITNLLGIGKRQFVWPAGENGTILMNMGKKGYDNPLSNVLNKPSHKPGQVFIHEMTHVWQIHHAEDLKFALNSMKNQIENEFVRDVYDYKCGKKWREYNYEQQGQIVEKCFKNREGSQASECEQTLVVENVRKGVSFRTVECQKLLNDIAAKNKEIQDRINALKFDYLKSIGESPVRNADGTYKVGNQKGLGHVQLPPSILNSDTKYKQLKTQLSQLVQKKNATNCR